MRNLLLPLLLLALIGAADSETKDLFNGKDLTDWKGDEKVWSVQDGVITGPHHRRESDQAQHLPDLDRRHRQGLRAHRQLQDQQWQFRHPIPQQGVARFRRHRLPGRHRRR
jgi:hypothetical protein